MKGRLFTQFNTKEQQNFGCFRPTCKVKTSLILKIMSAHHKKVYLLKYMMLKETVLIKKC